MYTCTCDIGVTYGYYIKDIWILGKMKGNFLLVSIYFSCFDSFMLKLLIADAIYFFSDHKDGGCNFFEWCDAPSPAPANARNNMVVHSETSATDMLCPCGAGAYLILTTKTGKNVGRQFFRCPLNQVNSGFSLVRQCYLNSWYFAITR